MNEMNWDDLRLFIAVANAGGLSGAASTTGLSAPTLGRRMLTLERALRQELFVRHAKGYDLTTQGTELLHQTTGLAGQIDGMTTARDNRLVKISAGVWTTRLLCENAAALAQNNVTLRFVAADHVLDIPHREALIGVRNHRPDHVGLAGQRVASIKFARYGQAGTPWVQVVGATPSAAWVKDNAPHGTIEVTHPTHALDLARAGAAQAVLPTFIGETEPNLTRQSRDIAALTHDQWVVSHNTDRFIPEVRRTIDRLVSVLKL
ncbi:LysR family transcriptional regulator [Octadecabacter sp. G9-8]|uniref:LysR family transcriptional regulator n=1 Tax=Octadecabacter dasysiphoniae TaxID=2909341 RepID=A0ABS9CRF0_9RHOB|nr:LysR family transcriptional regulator [Octadecabacter dasysiphoniae]MCF2869815.1 LysR family transcriptional regulator [Octadecabacter dasysiphoniae]